MPADQSNEVESLTALSDDFVTSGPEIHRAGSHTQCLHTLNMHASFLTATLRWFGTKSTIFIHRLPYFAIEISLHALRRRNAMKLKKSFNRHR